MTSDQKQTPTATDDRSPTAKAMDLVHKITSISIGLVLPILGGVYLDRWLETRVVFLLLGLALGLAVAGLQLMKLVSSLQAKQ